MHPRSSQPSPVAADAETYCSCCVTSTGELQPFDERFEKMVDWQLRQKPGLSRADAERDTYAFMGKMPAWKDHPRVIAALRGQV